MTLAALLTLAPGPPDSKVEYVSGGEALAPAERDRAAHILADDAMALRCGQSPALERWRAVRDGGSPGDGSAGTVRAYAGIGFGLPDEPATADHLQGLVAELLWNRLLKERTQGSGGRALVHAHSVKPDPLEPGGDGLVVYRVGARSCSGCGRSRSTTPKRPVSATIRRASKQLSSRGQRVPGQARRARDRRAARAARRFYAEIVELWLDGSDRAGVGVSVGTSEPMLPAGPPTFGSIATAFPHFTQPGQREGIVVAVPDFPAFAPA